MAHFPGQPAATEQQAVITDHAAADAGADSQIQNMVMALRNPEAPFTQRSKVGIVANPGGYAEALFQFGTNREVFPASDVRRGKNDAGCDA